VSCVLVQFMTQVVFAVGLAPGCCAASRGGVTLPTAGDGGRKQALWQVAACALHDIMQLVVVDVCADAVLASAASAMTPARTAIPRMLTSLGLDRADTIARGRRGRNADPDDGYAVRM